MLSNTIHHWRIQEGVPFEVYRIIWSEDKDLKIPFISIKKQAVTAPFDIPLDGAVLVIDPADVTVREGCYELTKKTDNLVVPTVYIKRDNDKVAAALGALNTAAFFATTIKSVKHQIPTTPPPPTPEKTEKSVTPPQKNPWKGLS